MISRTSLLIAGGLLAVAVLLVVKKNTQGGVAVAVGTAAGQAVVDAGAGVVLGLGDSLGLPRTNLTACEQAKADGRTWDASFACPTGDFLSYLWS